jgi:diketogulonate reductase-like aldo/keto reductase
MPRLMMGSFQVKSSNQMNHLVQQSIALSGKGFDTSPSYGTEGMLGEAVEKCLKSFHDLQREDLFIQTKIDAWQMIAGKGDVRPYMEAGFQKLKVDYLDSLVIHWPYPTYLVETWKCFEQLYREGYVRAIGVCNVKKRHLQLLEEQGSILPHIVQNEINPLNTDEETVEYALSKGITVQSYSPLARMLPEIRESEVLAQLANKYEVSIVQLMLRWHLDRGLVPIVKTDKPYRIAENFDIFDFELSDDEMAAISAHDMGYSGTRAKHFEPSFVRMCLGKE